MKLIENSIAIENLLTSVSYADLEDEMASCDIAQVNAKESPEESTSGKADTKKVMKITSLPNGIHEKIASPIKCNGNVHGCYDDISDDDYQLVLESSSDEGGSPSKKIDEDTISAPQIVQEIEDLLGIDASSVGIDDELDKELVNLDGSESVDLNEKDDVNLVNGEVINNIPQEIQDVFEDQAEDTSHKIDENYFLNEGKREEKKVEEVNKPAETAECDSSSNMNLVFDEVEIGTDNIEMPDTSLVVNDDQKNSIEDSNEASVTEQISENGLHLSENDCVVVSTTENNVINEESEKPDIFETVDKVTEVCSKRVDNKNETFEKGVKAFMEATTTNSSEEDQEMEAGVLTETSSLSESSVKGAVLDSVKMSDNEEKTENVQGTTAISSEVGREQLKSCVTKITENMDIDSKNQIEIDITTSSSSEGEGTRKRTASFGEEEIELKKPKLESEEVNKTESTSQVLKRPCSETLENGIKRTKAMSNLQTVDISDEKALNEHLTSSNTFTENHCKMDIDKEVQIKTSAEKSDSSNSDPKLGDEQKLNDNLESNQVVKNENDHRNLVVSEEEVISSQLVTTVGSISSTDSSGSEVIEEKAPLLASDKILSAAANSQEFIEDRMHSSGLDSAMKDCIQSCEVDINLTKDSSEVTLKKLTAMSEVSTTEKGIDEPLVESNSNSGSDKILETKELGTITTKEIKTVLSEENKKDFEVCSSSTDSLNGEAGLKFDSTCEQSLKESCDKPLLQMECKSKPKLGETPSVKLNYKSLTNPEKLDEQISKPIHMDVGKKPEPDDKKTELLSSSLLKQKKSTLQSKLIHTKKVKSPFNMLSKNMLKNKTKSKQVTNLDMAIESVVEKARLGSSMALPLLKKFHKDQLKKLTRSDLEETVVLKICEAVTDRSEIGQMRLRCQSLEQNNEVWRKKAMQFEKQNRELEMVLKRFLAETAQAKRDNQNKMVLPIKVTRSVGLQVVLASSMHGTLVSSRNRMNAEASQNETNRLANQQPQQQQVVRGNRADNEPTKEPVKTTFTHPVPPTMNMRGRGRATKMLQNPGPSTSTAALPTHLPPPPKVTPPSTPVKPTATPNKTVTTPSKDMEVIDLTDKEEKAKAPPSPVGGPIRVAPSTQVCFVQQQNTTSTPAQQMAYIVQKTGQRQQYLVTTSSPSSPRPVCTVSHRPPPALAMPVFRAGGQIIPVQTSPQVGVRTPNSTVMTTRQVPPAIRLQSQISMLRHPAPLPAGPLAAAKPGFKSPPPKPQLKIAKTVNGIMLSWSMTLSKDLAEMASYQLYAYQEGTQPPNTNLWKKVGDVKALPLPMACTLTQFIEGHKYHFAVRAVDVHGRIGPFSIPSSIMLTK